MSDEAALRFLGLVVQRLSAVDARIELGGAPPADAQSVWVALNAHRRVVAVFQAEPPKDAASDLAELVAAFAASADAPQSEGPAALARRTLPTEIDAELNGLAMRARAAVAVLIDVSSPVVWGRSHGECPADVGPLLDIAEAVADEDTTDLLLRPAAWPTRLQERAHGNIDMARRILMAALGVKTARTASAGSGNAVHTALRHGPFTFMIRSLAGVYRLVLGFEGGFSEPHAAGVLQRGITEIEHLIVKLPPTDPPNGPDRQRARVLSISRPPPAPKS